jgi:hypothetical protein
MYVCVAKSPLVISGSVFENQAIGSHVYQEHKQHHSSSSSSALSAREMALFLVTIPCAICASRYSSNDPYDDKPCHICNNIGQWLNGGEFHVLDV